MLERFKYKNHQNEIIDFGANGIYVKTNDLHDYQWSITKRNNRISSISKDVEQRKIPVVVICNSAAEGTAAVNRMMEVFERDVLSLQPGKILLNNYYFTCYVTGSKKSNYLVNKRYMELTLSVESDYPFWIKETTVSFRPGETTGDDQTNTAFLDYAYDYPFDYRNGLIRNYLDNNNFVNSNFIITIFGACSNPSIVIGDHTYQVNTNVNDGEYLTIDSSAKTIKLTANDGSATSKFNDRNRSSYIFEPIPTGRSVVTWGGSYGFDITLKEERSEPKWI